MRAVRRFLIRLTASLTRRRDERRLAEEIEDHVALQTAENVRAGLPPAEARRQALLKLGAVEAIKEGYRDEQRLPFFEILGRDVTYALRQLRRSPLFAVTATISLAVGIGANAAIFTLADRVLLKSLPVPDPHELVFVTDARSRQQSSPRFSYPAYASLEDSTALAGIAAHFAMSVNVSTSEQAMRSRGELVSGNYFDVIGATTQLGRPFTPVDDRVPGGHAVAVIGDGFWRRVFGADPSAVGRDLRINRHTFTIISVAARDFTGTDVGLPTDLWLPMMMQKELGRDLLTDVRTNWIEMIGRLKPGGNPERAAAELTAYVDGRAPMLAGRELMLLPAGKGSSPLRREIGPALRVLLALSGLALLLACVNVAGLLVVRSDSRQRETAIRLALGARRSSLVRQALTETLVLAAIGGTAGLLIAPWAAGLLVASQPDRLGIDASLDLRVFLFGIAAWIVTGLLVGQAPILASRKVGLTQASGNYAPTRGIHRLLSVRDVIVTCQIAASLVMLIGAALFVQSLRSLSSVDTGFQADDVLLLSVDPGSTGYDAGRIEGFWRETLERVERIPGVQSVSLARIVPLVAGRQRQPVRNPTTGDVAEIDTNFVGPRYFRTLGIPVVRGREFDASDGKTSRPVVIVNERMARAFWPAEDPIGKEVPIGPNNSPLAAIVGIVKDVKYRDLRADGEPMLYLPILQTRSTSAMTLHVRAAGDASALAGTIRREMRTVDANVPPFGITMLDDQLNGSLAQLRQAAMLTSGFGVVALLLSGIGVYSVTALAVSRRTREIGIRRALGAQRGQIVRVIGRRGLTLIVAGIVLGVLGSLGFTRIVDSLLYGITATDTTTFAGMSVMLAAVSLAAVCIAARAATRLDPVRAIRCE